MVKKNNQYRISSFSRKIASINYFGYTAIEPLKTKIDKNKEDFVQSSFICFNLGKKKKLFIQENCALFCKLDTDDCQVLF